jgi:uncharacterized protein (TIGR03086 family)
MTTENLERAFADTRAIVANVKADQLGDATPCESWTVKDLLDHIIGGSYYFAASVNDGKAPEGGPATEWNPANMVGVLDGGIKDAVAAFGAPGAMEKTIQLPFGPLPAAAWMGLATTDAFIHGWDLAKATGQSTDIDPELAGQLLEGAKMMIAPAFRGADTVMPFGAEQSAPAGASNADQLAAFLGRTV